MKILVIGSGGREHAICKKFAQSNNLTKLYASPGNAGISEIAECINLDLKNHQNVIDFCQNENIDLIFVGPEQPLVDGIVDDLTKAGLKVFGPNKFASQLEGSKDFMKQIAYKNNIPTAKYQTFENYDEAYQFGKNLGFPCVIKADGLAAGKGVVIVNDEDELKINLQEFFAGKFGEASKKIIIEEFLTGVEVSYFVISDGKNFVKIGSACDHKKVGEGETGLNTGGMGVFTPSPFINQENEEIIIEKIIKPTLQYFADNNNPFVGILFAGIILTDSGPKLLEFNIRFGDPETQILLPKIKNDFVELISKACEQKLENYQIELDDEKYVGVVMCAQGYPEKYEKNVEIKNIYQALKLENIDILHAGTKLENNKILSNGGRVLNIISNAKTFKEARKNAYEAVDLIDFEGGFVRKDIAQKVEDL